MSERIPGTKIAERLFLRPEGATMAEVIAATGARQHNLLERLKARGTTVRSRKEGCTTRYFAIPPANPEFEMTVTAKGQVTLPKELRQHLGVRAGEKLKATIENDRIILARKSDSLQDLFGLLHRPGMRPRTLEEIEDGIIAGAVSRAMRGLRPPKQ